MAAFIHNMRDNVFLATKSLRIKAAQARAKNWAGRAERMLVMIVQIGNLVLFPQIV